MVKGCSCPHRPLLAYDTTPGLAYPTFLRRYQRTDIHLSLPASLVSAIDRVADERSVRRVHVIREAVASYLAQLEAERIDRELRAYADDLAEQSGTFTRETDAHTVERLLRETEW